MKVENPPKGNKKLIKFAAVIILVAMIYYVTIPIIIILQTRKKIVENPSLSRTAIVLGAGVDEKGTPSDYLEDRLDLAGELYEQGYFDEIIASGNNSNKNNYEVNVMTEELINRAVSSEGIIGDDFGNRTYDSCIRAKEIFSVNKAVLITQRFHLYRSIWLCEQLGVEVEGVSATRASYKYGWYYMLRESFAMHKAVIDIYLLKPDYEINNDIIDCEELDY